MLKESRMLHAHGELYPHHYSSLLKYSNLLKAKRLSHDATHKKSIDRLQLEKDQEPISESPNSLPKLEVLEYYQIVNPKEKDTSSSNNKRVEHQQLQPLKSLQQHEAATKKESANSKPDLTLKTANLYRSYLKYSSTNPFECNYDVVNKKKNAELLSDSTYRFNRATSSLSILSHSIEFKKFSAASAQANFITTTDNTSQNPVPLEFTSSSTGRIMIRQPPNHNSSSRLNNESSLMESKSSGAGRMAQPSESAGHRKNSARNKPSNATTTNNQFLNYRNEEYLINGSSQNGKKSKEVNSRLDNSGSRLKSAVNKENQVTENSVEQTTSRNKGPENYLESSKLEHIRKWVTEVNRVQAKSGKWGETINKILFYD